MCGVAVEVGSRGCGWEDELAERFVGGGVDDRGCHSRAAQLVTGNRGPVLALVTGATRAARGQRSVYAATDDNDAAPLAVATNYGQVRAGTFLTAASLPTNP